MAPLIFIVDDDPSIVKFLKYRIEDKLEYKTKTFSNGLEALDHIGENPDLILLDIMMPEVSGIEILGEIKKINPELPVIISIRPGRCEYSG